MSSRPGLDGAGRRGSIAFRLTLWYAVLSLLLVAAAGTMLYLVLADCLRRDDDQWLTGQIADISRLLTLHPSNAAGLHRDTVMLPGSSMRVLDAEGKQLMETAAQGGNLTGNSAAALDAVSGKPDRGRDWRRGDAVFRVMYSRVRAGSGFTVQVAIDRSDEEQTLKSYQRIMLSVLAAALGVAIVGGHLIARRSLEPVSRLAAIIDELGAAHLCRRIADDGWPRELGPLAANFDQLLARLDNSFARVSRFSADIAHELRTPLHILRGEAELALSKTRSGDDYRECIVSATEEYARLMRMVDALLFLARTDSPESFADKQTLVLEEEVGSVCAFYQALADEQETALDISGAAVLAADPGLLRRALANLIINALRHTPSGGRISIALEALSGHGAQITVSDNGEGIAAKDLPYVFDRLYRADHARSGHGAGAGLGLAIVQSIMQLHGGSASLSSVAGRGTVARLVFPGVAANPT
ncbi:heavy metal sensor histidine kinase [Massilia sp. TSP1-1-2]|uniref:heavy metal sensor histidine kinase n=1 Tax=Massilia sp. TSP1-1-2 TaxID=2804649 RepID=UPI003CEF9BA3